MKYLKYLLMGLLLAGCVSATGNTKDKGIEVNKYYISYSNGME